jgi:hypothetical protein
MLSSITPLGERGRNNRWWLTAAAYITGSIAGGAAMGAALGALGGLIRWATSEAGPFGGVVRRATSGAGLFDGRLPLALLGIVALLGFLADLRVARLRVPTMNRQVDERWLTTYRGWVYGVGYGFQLGLGVVTIVTSAATWVTLAVALLTGSWPVGLVVGSVFGAARSLPLLLAAPARSPGALRDLLLRQQRWSGPARRAAIGGQCLVGVLALLTLLVVP